MTDEFRDDEEFRESADTEVVATGDGWGEPLHADAGTEPADTEDEVDHQADGDASKREVVVSGDGWGEPLHDDATVESTDTSPPDDGMDTPDSDVSREVVAGDDWTEELQTSDSLSEEAPLKAETSDGSVDKSTDDLGDTSRQEQIDQARDAVAKAYEEAEATREPELTDLEYTDFNVREGDNVNSVAQVELFEGDRQWVKFAEGEAMDMRDAIPADTGWKREVAAYELDSLLDIGVVPHTTAVKDEFLGKGSMQEHVPFEGRPIDTYSKVDGDRMAALDYITGNSDRHSGNFMTDSDGHPRAIDNGYSFPTSAVDGIRSDFVASRLGEPLDADLVSSLRSVDSFHLDRVLERCGIEDSARAGAIERFREVQRTGMITGDAWPGRITDSALRTVRQER